MDASIYKWDWIIELDCPECSDYIHLAYLPKGVFPKYLLAKDQDNPELESGYKIGYSLFLPLPKILCLLEILTARIIKSNKAVKKNVDYMLSNTPFSLLRFAIARLFFPRELGVV